MSQTQNQKLGFVVAGLLLAILMASMDNTIVVTAMGTIVGDLGGLDSFVWVVSAFMVAEMAGMPIFGKLSDMYGRKRFFFLAASFSWRDQHCAERLQPLSKFQHIPRDPGNWRRRAHSDCFYDYL